MSVVDWQDERVYSGYRCSYRGPGQEGLLRPERSAGAQYEPDVSLKKRADSSDRRNTGVVREARWLGSPVRRRTAKRVGSHG